MVAGGGGGWQRAGVVGLGYTYTGNMPGVFGSSSGRQLGWIFWNKTTINFKNISDKEALRFVNKKELFGLVLEEIHV